MVILLHGYNFTLCSVCIFECFQFEKKIWENTQCLGPIFSGGFSFHVWVLTQGETSLFTSELAEIGWL